MCVLRCKLAFWEGGDAAWEWTTTRHLVCAHTNACTSLDADTAMRALRFAIYGSWPLCGCTRSALRLIHRCRSADGGAFLCVRLLVFGPDGRAGGGHLVFRRFTVEAPPHARPRVAALPAGPLLVVHHAGYHRIRGALGLSRFFRVFLLTLFGV